jgi:hypothetical protein
MQPPHPPYPSASFRDNCGLKECCEPPQLYGARPRNAPASRSLLLFALQSSDGTATLPYQVYSTDNTEQALNSGDIFAIFTDAGEQSGFVRIDQKDITKTDTYTGNLRFSFFVSDAE